MLLCVQKSYTQEFCTHWISYPIPNDSSEVLFSQVYPTSMRPRQAFISFASSGKLKIYVNERNISKEIFYENPDSTTICIYTYNITKFLQPDTNIIAVWYAPQESTAISKQLSLEFYGTDATGKPFYYKADGNWKCKMLKGCYVKGDIEAFDSRHYDNRWKSSDYNREEWSNPLGVCQQGQMYDVTRNDFYQSLPYIHHVFTPIGSHRDHQGLHYDFKREFSGTPRITLREAKKGEILLIDGFKYVCKGELDEQAFRHFTTITQSSICIKGDTKFSKSQVTNVEGLGT